MQPRIQYDMCLLTLSDRKFCHSEFIVYFAVVFCWGLSAKKHIWGCLKIELVKQETVVIVHHFLVNTVIPCPTLGFRGSDHSVLDTTAHTFFVGMTGLQECRHFLCEVHMKYCKNITYLESTSAN